VADSVTGHHKDESQPLVLARELLRPERILFVSRGFLDDLLSALKRATLSVIGAAA